MTAGTPLDCREVVDRLYEFLDQELTPDVQRAVRAHLMACAHCFALHRFEDAYHRFVEARVRAGHAPPALRRRILGLLLTERDPGAS